MYASKIRGTISNIILNKIINTTLLFLPLFFMSWNQRSKTFSMYTKGLFLSNIVHKSVLIRVSEHFSFAKIIHPPHSCGISRCWLDSMIIAQVCRRLATRKGHSKMCSFTVLGCPKTSQYLVLPPLVSCSATHLFRIELIRLLIVACGMLVHSSSMAVWSCWILARTRTDPEHPKHAQWVTCPVSMLAMQELGCFQLPGIVYRSLQHGAVHYHAETWGQVVDEWHNNGPQDLVTVSLCIQNAINTIHLCSLSITYTCPYHNPTMSHSIHNVDISKPLTHTTPYTLSAICPVHWKPGFIRLENTSPKCHTPSNVSICPLKSVTAVRSRPRWGWQACRWASLRRFLTVCAEILWFCIPIVAAAVSDDLGGKDTGCGGHGLVQFKASRI